MKTYKIISPIVLSFNGPQEQYDSLIVEGYLETDGETIWLLRQGNKQETINQAQAINHWLDAGDIEIVS